MKKYYHQALLLIIVFFISSSLFGQITKYDTITSNINSNIWRPKPGTKYFYTQLWGGGAGGNAGWADGQNGYNGTGGGGGGSFSQILTFTVTATTQSSGYAYLVGAGGGINGNGGNTWFSQSNIYFANGGFIRGQGKIKAQNEFISFSSYGGTGGQSWRSIFGTRWQGGGGGSGRTTADGSPGQDAGDGYNGYGGDGIGGGGKTNEYSPGTPGGGGSGDQAGARGEIRIIYSCDYTPGTIDSAHTVPYPQEWPAGTDLITNVESPTGYGYTYSWEQSTDNVTWIIVPGANQLTLAIPAIQKDTWFRRVINGCNPDPAKNRSNVVLIKVFSQGNGKKNGIISGKVTSKNQTTGVQGVTITVQKTISLKGSPQTFKYTDTTDQDGNYAVAPIFYGDNSVEGGDPNSVSFTIIASKTGHKLSTRNPVTLSNIISTSASNNFIDSTVYPITGRVTQPLCASCLPGSQGPYGAGNIKISTNDQSVFDVYSDSLRADSIGYLAITVADPKSYIFTPSYLNHSFSPASINLSITADVTNVDFSDTSTKVISGKLTDIAGRKIGSGRLKFEGVYKLKDTTITTFKKLADIIDSTYTVRLPAGKYRVTVDAFTPGYEATNDRYVTETDVKDFFNTRAIEPLIDISTKDTVRNLVYHRPPVVVLNGLKDTACNTNPAKNPGIIFRTNARKPFQVYVFEGPASLGNRVQITPRNNQPDTLADYIRFYTNVTSFKAEANADTIFFRLKNEPVQPMLDSFFLPGVPNNVGDFTKKFEMHYIDRYGRRAAPFTPKTTVVGILNPTKTFTTAFPEIPYLILHAPPGDNSYSFWEKDSSYQVATSVSVLKENGRDGFVNVSLAPTISVEAEGLGGSIGVEIQGIATLNYNHEYSVNNNTTDELVETITTNKRFETVKNPIVTGNSGDVYIGHGTNYILGKSIYVDFIENKPFGACEIDTSSRLIMAPKGFRTEFAYAEDHIVNVIIPQQQRLHDEATDSTAKANAKSQIDVWNQVIEDNKKNKKNATFLQNRSFSYGVKVDESATNTRSSTHNITYNVVVGNNIAFELGLYAGGLGASGGAVITMRETTTNDTVYTTDKAVTMGYHLEDDDPGDYYSVDIKKDPFHGTPVFDLLAGANSCPPEEGAQKRDLPQIISGGGTFNNWDPNIENFFNITLANKSESGEARKYNLSVDATSAQDLQITANGTINLVGTQVAYQLDYGQTLPVQIGVKRVNPNDKRFSFPNVLFSLTDNCGFDNLFDPNTQSLAKYTFNYASPCGSIALASPADGWLINSGSSTNLPITMNGYTLANIDSITLEYCTNKVKGKDWKNGFTVKKAAISDPNSFTFPWNIGSLADTIYAVRLRMVCQNGNILYSAEASGTIDRKSPLLLGSPLPVSQLYNPDVDEISFNYSENLDNTNLNQGAVEVVRRSDNSIVPVLVNEQNGKLIITPLNSLGSTIDSFRVIVRNITDLYGNVRTKPDTSFFWLDLTAPSVLYTGTNTASLRAVKPVITEGSADSIELHFRLSEKTKKITKVYFNLTGTAQKDIDYSSHYRDTIIQIKRVNCGLPGCSDSSIHLVYLNQFSGQQGYVYIDSNKTETIIKIAAIPDFENEADETIVVNLVNGLDYKLQDSASATMTILNSGLPCPPANILYVNEKATGNNTGVSWLNAMKSLKEALNTGCPNVTQIWVAKGTYKPTTNTSRDSSFVMKNNLAIYGGFAGTETFLDQRNIRSNPTVLSGDIGIANNNADNSYNVVRNLNNGLNSTAILDGFTVTGGKGNGAGFGSYGAGVINVSSTPSFFNCLIIGNNASVYGGGMYNNGASPLVVNSVIAGNTADYGGGLYNESAATKLVNCSFSGNLAFTDGGAVATYGAVTPVITNSILWGNSSSIRNAGGSTPAVTYSIVQDGYSGTGNLNTDPLFILQPTQGLGTTADLRLQGCSPAINVGSNAALPSGINTDLASLSRIVNTTVDMGAYERPATALSTIIYVDATAKGNNSGESWVNAYTNFSSALNELNFCAPGTNIQIAAGVYVAPANGTYNFNKLDATIQGGYANGGSISANPTVNSTIFKGDVQVLKSLRIDGIKVQKL